MSAIVVGIGFGELSLIRKCNSLVRGKWLVFVVLVVLVNLPAIKGDGECIYRAEI